MSPRQHLEQSYDFLPKTFYDLGAKGVEKLQGHMVLEQPEVPKHFIGREPSPQEAQRSYNFRVEGIEKLEGFMDPVAAETMAQVIEEFVMRNTDGSRISNTRGISKIPGGRDQVYLTGDRSEAFHEFALQHSRSPEILSFLSELKAKISDIASANHGHLSEDFLALVGSPEMQPPHIDLKEGQKQIITALTPTIPTLVYDPRVEKPSVQEAFDFMNVDVKYATSDHMRYLVNGGTPLAQPAALLFERMVPACEDFKPGDAVHMGDGIVHAGPKVEQRSGEPPRIVLFATYSTVSADQYHSDFQYKPWDWAAFPEVPAHVAYQRLLEVRKAARSQGMNIQPWLFEDGDRAWACRTLSTAAFLPQDQVEELVHVWRD
jgi:hypothetical protein